MKCLCEFCPMEPRAAVIRDQGRFLPSRLEFSTKDMTRRSLFALHEDTKSDLRTVDTNPPANHCKACAPWSHKTKTFGRFPCYSSPAIAWKAADSLRECTPDCKHEEPPEDGECPW